jgi:HEAT repeat protein
MAADSFTDSTNPKYDAAPTWVDRNPRYNVTLSLAAATAAKDAELSRAIAQIKGSSEDRRQAAEYFAKRRNPDYLEILNTLAADPDEETRLTAVKAIVKLMAPESTPFLISKLEDPSPFIRMAACWGLCHRGTRQVVDALCRQFTIEKVPQVDECLIQALVFIKDQNETPPEAKYIINAMHRATPSQGRGLRM